MATIHISDNSLGIHIEIVAEKPEQVQPWLDWIRRNEFYSLDQPQPEEPSEEEIDEERLDR